MSISLTLVHFSQQHHKNNSQVFASEDWTSLLSIHRADIEVKAQNNNENVATTRVFPFLCWHFKLESGPYVYFMNHIFPTFHFSINACQLMKNIMEIFITKMFWKIKQMKYVFHKAVKISFWKIKTYLPKWIRLI